MTLQYNKPVEVTKMQYIAVMKEFSWVVAGREDTGKYYIKLLFTKYRKYVELILKSIK